MSRLVMILSAALLLASCATRPSSLTSAARVVIPAGQLPGTLGQPGWTPTDAQIASCEAALAQALASKRLDLGTYYLRLGGITRDGSRRLIGMAADKRASSPEFLLPPSENRILLGAYGGGDAYFRFEYDLDQNKLMKLDFNAPL
ncbi:MAG: hypothetical protein JNN01_16150 [Opitutaceae bacterium]|nr:hypothetical protein [Opitutaceae bacterium]